MNLNQIKKKLNDNAELVFKKLGMDYEAFHDNIYCTCPVHEASDNPRAFSFSRAKGIWKCWTRDCQSEHGNDIFGLIKGALSQQRGEEVEFKDALRWACDTLNIKRGYTNDVETVETEEKEEPFYDVINILTKKPKIIQDNPIELDCTLEYPSEYFIGRGFKREQ